MTIKTPPDWELIESLYRAGVLSVREIAASQGITHGAINKRAKRDSWVRDLKAKIQAKADALVSKATVSTLVSTDTRLSEREIVDGVADKITDIRLGHRTDISRSRRLAIKLLDELESLTDNRDLFEQLGELLRSEDDKGQDKRNDLYHKIIDLPNRTKTMKELAETLRVLIALERQAYGIDDATAEESYEDRLARLMGGK